MKILVPYSKKNIEKFSNINFSFCILITTKVEKERGRMKKSQKAIKGCQSALRVPTFLGHPAKSNMEDHTRHPSYPIYRNDVPILD